MNATTAFNSFQELVAWTDKYASEIALPADERSLLVSGCFDVALETQAAIALLYSSSMPAPMFALLRVLSESVVRGLWFKHCATEKELKKFQKKKIDKEFGELVCEIEEVLGTPNGILSAFKISAWSAMNDFTHTGFIQVSRRHKPGRIEANYPEQDIVKALGLAGALGLIAAGELVEMSSRRDLLPMFLEKMSTYTGHPPNKSPS